MYASVTSNAFLPFLIVAIGLRWGSLAASASAQVTVSGLTDRVTDQAD